MANSSFHPSGIQPRLSVSPSVIAHAGRPTNANTHSSSTEVLAFHNCLDEFTERNCSVAFVSTDSKYTLWQWQHLGRNQGGIGRVNVPLLSDANHQMSRQYGVLLESLGLDLRGMFIIDASGTIQHVSFRKLKTYF
jgi:alkyl hydroperoxide reductase subunit AhpC